MNEKLHALPKAKIEQSFLTWFLWLVPLAAAGLCAWFVFHDFIFSGPTITIYFQNADGLQEQNSPIKYDGIKIGEIKSLKLAKNGGVAVRAKIDRSAAEVARRGSQFWIVRPEIKLGAVSGLRTIVSGNYVTVLPGNGARTNIFTGLEEAPIQPIQSLQITLLANDLDSIESQSQIFYRGVQVGEVLDYRIADDARHIIIHARIREEFESLVHVDSKFWNAGGINVHVGLFSGAQISAESAQTLVAGGVAFATPPDYGAPATNGTVFVLNEKQDSAWKDWNPAIPLQSVSEGQNAKNTSPQINSK